MSRIEHCREKLLAIVFAILAKKDLGKLLSEMYRRKIIANIARITNSTRIESCSKTFLANFCRNFSKNMFSRNCLQKSKEVCTNRKSNKNFHCNKKNLVKIARITRIATKRKFRLIKKKVKKVLKKSANVAEIEKVTRIFCCNNNNNNKR